MSTVSCLFCSPDPNAIVLENDYAIFIQTEQPILIGSGLIIPRSHRQTVFDLTVVEWCETYALLQQVKTLLDEQYEPDGYNVGWNSGDAAGQEILHSHLHVIPRFKDEPLAGKGIRWWLKQEENRR
ncbi:HIT family protein, partial [Ferroacidibacillus organovorans]|uniref:HIT family protein n=1 Tax=Ferroacidibacillus organovorans TaxID=1765683 RepID=UPI0009EE7114